MKKKYRIRVLGYTGETAVVMKLSKEELKVLKLLRQKVNKAAENFYMPRIKIKEVRRCIKLTK